MASALPTVFTVLTGLCLALTFYALWRAMRVLATATASGDLGRGEESDSADRRALLQEKQSLLQSLRDLEQEHAVGKVSDMDFEAINARLRGRAREVLQALDAQVAPYREQAEVLVQQFAVAPASDPPRKSQPVPALTPDAESARVDAPSCAACQTKNEADAVFCKKCGARIAADPGAATT